VLHLSDLHCAERVAVVSSLRGWPSAVMVNSVDRAHGSGTTQVVPALLGPDENQLQVSANQ
jgi:hypothetical protein